MPCRDYYDENLIAYYENTVEELEKQVSFAESALCAVIEALKICDAEGPFSNGHDYLRWINFKEAGINRSELESWYKKHKELDDVIRKEKRLQQIKKDALNKLSEEEKEALGIKHN